MARNDQHAHLAARVDGIPPEVLLRTDRTLRYERGGMVYATDGKLGTLRQVVVDQRAGEVTALVIEVDRTGQLVLVPPQAVRKTGGSAVFLAGTREQFNAWLPTAPTFEPKKATRANPKSLARVRSNGHPGRNMILSAGRDFLETGEPEAVATGQSGAMSVGATP
jgi:PRC-barrel domain protein